MIANNKANLAVVKSVHEVKIDLLQVLKIENFKSGWIFIYFN